MIATDDSRRHGRRICDRDPGRITGLCKTGQQPFSHLVLTSKKMVTASGLHPHTIGAIGGCEGRQPLAPQGEHLQCGLIGRKFGLCHVQVRLHGPGLCQWHSAADSQSQGYGIGCCHQKPATLRRVERQSAARRGWLLFLVSLDRPEGQPQGENTSGHGVSG